MPDIHESAVICIARNVNNEVHPPVMNNLMCQTVSLRNQGRGAARAESAGWLTLYLLSCIGSYFKYVLIDRMMSSAEHKPTLPEALAVMDNAPPPTCCTFACKTTCCRGPGQTAGDFLCVVVDVSLVRAVGN